MSFYELLQLDPVTLKGYISKSESIKDKSYYWMVIIIRSLLLVGFAILFISLLNYIFGAEYSNISVFIFCILLSSRFVGFGYNIKHSIAGMGAVFLVMALSPIINTMCGAYIGIFVNFISILTILVITSENPEMGNPGLYLFGYVFVSDVDPSMIIGRLMVFATGFIICSIVMYRNNKEKDKDISIDEVLSRFNIKREKSQWMLKTAFIMSIVFFIGNIIDFDKFIWIGFACSSILTAYNADLPQRVYDRIFGAIFGSGLFFLLSIFIPERSFMIIGPISGFVLGLCSTYRSKTIFNCFGALSTARILYGTTEAVSIRIANNIMGTFIAFVGICAISAIISISAIILKNREFQNME